MIQPELYKKTVDILYQAYFNDTLEHDRCMACAVGNMVKAACNYKGLWRSYWDEVFSTVPSIGHQFVNRKMYFGEAKKQIDATGYHWEDLAKIEYAFETAPKGNSSEDWMFNGLVAVLEVLKEIHQVDESEATEAAKPFHNHYQTLTA